MYWVCIYPEKVCLIHLSPCKCSFLSFCSYMDKWNGHYVWLAASLQRCPGSVSTLLWPKRIIHWQHCSHVFPLHPSAHGWPLPSPSFLSSNSYVINCKHRPVQNNYTKYLSIQLTNPTPQRWGSTTEGPPTNCWFYLNMWWHSLFLWFHQNMQWNLLLSKYVVTLLYMIVSSKHVVTLTSLIVLSKHLVSLTGR